MNAPYHHQFDPAGPAHDEHMKGMPALHQTARHPESEVVTEAHMNAPYHHQFDGLSHGQEHMKGMPAIHHTTRHPESEVVTEVHMDAPYHHQFDGHRTFQGDEHMMRVPQDPHPFEYHPKGEATAELVEAQEIHHQLARLDAYVAEQGDAYSTILVRGECHILKAGGAGCRQQLLYSFPTTNAADVKATVMSFLLNKEDSLEVRSEKLRNHSADAIYVPDKPDRHHHSY